MDSQQATIVGREQVDAGEFVILGHAKNAGREATQMKMQLTMQRGLCSKNTLKKSRAICKM